MSMYIEHKMKPAVAPFAPIDAANAELEVTMTQVAPGDGPMAVHVRTVKVLYPMQRGLPPAPDGGALFIGRLRLQDKATGTIWTVDLRADEHDGE